MIGTRKNAELWRLFQAMSKGDRKALAVVKRLAATARAIDPDCSIGPFGVLESIQTYSLTPPEFIKLDRLCKSNPLLLNALDYDVFIKTNAGKTQEEKDDLLVECIEDVKKAIKNNFRTLNVQNLLIKGRALHGRFGQYHNPKRHP